MKQLYIHHFFFSKIMSQIVCDKEITKNKIYKQYLVQMMERLASTHISLLIVHATCTNQ